MCSVVAILGENTGSSTRHHVRWTGCCGKQISAGALLPHVQNDSNDRRTAPQRRRRCFGRALRRQRKHGVCTCLQYPTRDTPRITCMLAYYVCSMNLNAVIHLCKYALCMRVCYVLSAGNETHSIQGCAQALCSGCHRGYKCSHGRCWRDLENRTRGQQRDTRYQSWSLLIHEQLERTAFPLLAEWELSTKSSPIQE